MNGEYIARVGRSIAAVGAVGLLVSLFLTWSAASHSNLLVLFGALNRRGGFVAASSKSAWNAYSVAGEVLALLVVLIIVAACLDRARLLVVAWIATLAGLGFTIDQIAHPPGATFTPPLGFARHLPANFVPHVLASPAGDGETLATVALVAMMIGLTVALASRLRAA